MMPTSSYRSRISSAISSSTPRFRMAVASSSLVLGRTASCRRQISRPPPSGRATPPAGHPASRSHPAVRPPPAAPNRPAHQQGHPGQDRVVDQDCPAAQCHSAEKRHPVERHHPVVHVAQRCPGVRKWPSGPAVRGCRPARVVAPSGACAALNIGNWRAFHPRSRQPSRRSPAFRGGKPGGRDGSVLGVGTASPLERRRGTPASGAPAEHPWRRPPMLRWTARGVVVHVGEEPGIARRCSSKRRRSTVRRSTVRRSTVSPSTVSPSTVRLTSGNPAASGSCPAAGCSLGSLDRRLPGTSTPPKLETARAGIKPTTSGEPASTPSARPGLGAHPRRRRWPAGRPRVEPPDGGSPRGPAPNAVGRARERS